MKTRAVVLGGLIGAVVVFLGYGGVEGVPPSVRGQDARDTAKVGTVSIRDIFRDCKANINYRDRAIGEQTRRNAEMDALEKKIAADEAGLKALKPGSSDYMKQYEALINAQAQYEAKKQFLTQQRGLEDRQWTEVLYKEVLRITKELAQKKGLEMVLEVDEPVFPMASTDELMMALQTHKVLYSDGCVSLTAEVVAEMDKIESKLKL